MVIIKILKVAIIIENIFLLFKNQKKPDGGGTHF